MKGKAYSRLLCHRDGALEEPAERLPERLLLDRRLDWRCDAIPHGRVELRDLGARSTGQRDGCARPRDDRHPVVTPDLDTEPAEHPDQLEHALELLVPSGKAEPKAIHRRVVLQ